MSLSDKQKLIASQAGFTDREISLFKQKLYNLMSTQFIGTNDFTLRPIEQCPQCGYRQFVKDKKP